VSLVAWLKQSAALDLSSETESVKSNTSEAPVLMCMLDLLCVFQLVGNAISTSAIDVLFGEFFFKRKHTKCIAQVV